MKLGKREPTLADSILARRGDSMFILDPNWVDRAMDNMVYAKKFVLDGQAAHYIGKMIKEHPRIIADAQDFAQRPFERMWVEMPFQPFWSAITGRPPDVTGDLRVGYLFDGPRVMVGSEGREVEGGPTRCGLMAVEYVLNKPMTPVEQLLLAKALGSSRLGLDIWFWGESAMNMARGPIETEMIWTPQGMRQVMQNPSNEWDRESMRCLRDNHTARLVPVRKDLEDDDEYYRHIIDGSGGDLRNIIAMLLFLNRTQDIQTTHEVPTSHGFIKAKLRPFSSHTVISLKVDPMPRLRKIVAGEGVRKRLHDVRGHYKHDRKAWAGCAHSYDPDLKGDFGTAWIEYEPLRWKCEICSGKRWWQPSHSRGCIDEGIIASSYAVTR